MISLICPFPHGSTVRAATRNYLGPKFAQAAMVRNGPQVLVRFRNNDKVAFNDQHQGSAGIPSIPRSKGIDVHIPSNYLMYRMP
jgi:hypothetical protein